METRKKKQKKINLKRCPFCGGGGMFCNHLQNDGLMTFKCNFVMCTDCGATTLQYVTKEEAAKAWNRREK